jgi:hypothetical protein
VSGGGFYPLTSGGTYAGPGASFYLGGDVPNQYFWIGYNDNYGSAGLPDKLSQIGKYTKEWFSGSPNYPANPNGENNKYLWLQGTSLGADANGLGAVLTWTAPYAGKFVFSGSYVNGNNGGLSTDFAIVDSSNRVLLSKVNLPAGAAASTFAFTNTMASGDVMQFQAGTAAIYGSQGSPLGLAVDIQAVSQTSYEAWATGYGLDPTVTSGPTAGAPTADPDKDGFYNSNEYAFGTNPTVPNGSLTSTSISGDTMTVSWAGPAAGVSYVVQMTTDLATTPFQDANPAIPITSTNGLMSFTNQVTGQKFFRVKATITNN